MAAAAAVVAVKRVKRAAISREIPTWRGDSDDDDDEYDGGITLFPNLYLIDLT
jgi:hypothetical protein